MHGEGVTCSNCHNPHSLKLKAEGNSLCTQCHSAEVFESPRHHHHASGGAGSLCADCHMPTTTYMGVDARRDHSLRIPRPAQSADVGAPNACNQCHRDRDAGWAQQRIEGWLEGSGRTLDRPPFADTFHAANRGQANVGAQLLQIANDTSLPAIVRGSAVLRHAPYHDCDSLATLQRLLDDEEVLVRQGALRSMDSLPLTIRYRLLR